MLAKTLSAAAPLACKSKMFMQLQEVENQIQCHYKPLWYLCLGLPKFNIFNLLSCFSPSVMPLHFLCSQYLQNWNRMELLLITFRQTVHENFPSFLIFH